MICRISAKLHWKLKERHKVAEQAAMSEKEAARVELEGKANALIYECISNNPQAFYELGRRIIPYISRKAIEKQAALLLQEGIRHEDVAYYPSVTFASAGHVFTDRMLCLYRESKETFARALARSWIRSCGAEIFKEYIVYGCLRESLMDLERRKAYREKAVQKRT